MEDQDQIIVYNKKNVDLSKVNKKDLPYIEPIIYGLLTYNEIMPPLLLKFEDCDNHYRSIVRGWNQVINLLDFTNTFANPTTRSITYDNIIDVSVNLSDADGKFVLILRIAKAKGDYHSGKKIK